MRVLHIGDKFEGANFNDMVKNVVGECHDRIYPSGTYLTRPNDSCIYAWFVMMDGHAHGSYYEGYTWENKISYKGKIIDETFCAYNGQQIEGYNFSEYYSKFLMYRQKRGFVPYRLAFVVDGDHRHCEFIGVFRLKEYYGETGLTCRHERVLDTFEIYSSRDVNIKYSKKDILQGDTTLKNLINKNLFNQNDLQLLSKFKFICDILEVEWPDIRQVDCTRIIKTINQMLLVGRLPTPIEIDNKSSQSESDRLDPNQPKPDTHIDYEKYVGAMVKIKDSSDGDEKYKSGWISRVDKKYCWVKFDDCEKQYVLEAINKSLTVVNMEE